MTTTNPPAVPNPAPKYRMGQQVLARTVRQPLTVIGMRLEPVYRDGYAIDGAEWQYRLADWRAGIAGPYYWNDWGHAREAELDRARAERPDEWPADVA